MVKNFDINNPGYSIKCKMYCLIPRGFSETVVYLHGFGGHKETKAAEHFADAYLAKRKNAAILVFDLPCHGSDVRKNLSLEVCDTYLSMVLDYVRGELKTDTIFAYGTSFGGYLLLKYLHDHVTNPFRKIALRCPAVNMCEVMMNRVLSPENRALIEKGKPAQAGFDRPIPVEKSFFDETEKEDIRKYEYFDYADDLLIIQGTKDEVILPSQVEKFAENNVITLISVEGADHRFQDLNKLKLAHSYIVDFFLAKE